MKNFLHKLVYGIEVETENEVKFSPRIYPPPLTTEESFRRRTIEDINFLLKEDKKDLAALEAKKLIDHLQKECGLV